MMRRLILPAALAAAFLGGMRLARGAGDEDMLKELVGHEEKLLDDLKKIEQACKDVIEIRKMRESGEYTLNDEEKKMERQGREDFHVFMERFRNDTLEVLEILDAAAGTRHAVDPLRRVYRKALDQLVTVAWNDEELDLLLGEISQTYGVPIQISGEMDRRRTMSLSGEMSLLSVLLQIENVFEGKFVVRDGHLWLELLPPEDEAPEAEPKKAAEPEKKPEKPPSPPKKQ
jgi:hypothetical protein